MTRFISTFVLCALASAAFAGTEVSHRRYRDETARAEYSWLDGCISKQLTISAAKTKLKEDGITVEGGPSVDITYAETHQCDPTAPARIGKQEFWFGEAAAASLQIDANLRWASVTGPVTVQVFRLDQAAYLGTKLLFIDLQWSSNDPLDKSGGTLVIKYPGYTEVNRLNGHYRLASAAGTVLDGSVNLLGGASGEFVQLYRLNAAETILIRD
jgi:hypothetical protein